METRKIVETQKEESINKKKTGKTKIKQNVIKITGQKTKVNKINKAIQNEKIKKRKEEKKRTYRNILKNENGIKNPFSQRQILEERRKKEIRDLLKKNISTRKKMKGGGPLGDKFIEIRRVEHGTSDVQRMGMTVDEYVLQELRGKVKRQFELIRRLANFSESVLTREEEKIKDLTIKELGDKIDINYQILLERGESDWELDDQPKKAFDYYKSKAIEKYEQEIKAGRIKRGNKQDLNEFIIEDMEVLLNQRDTALVGKAYRIENYLSDNQKFRTQLEQIQREKAVQLEEFQRELERKDGQLTEVSRVLKQKEDELTAFLQAVRENVGESKSLFETNLENYEGLRATSLRTEGQLADLQHSYADLQQQLRREKQLHSEQVSRSAYIIEGMQQDLRREQEQHREQVGKSTFIIEQQIQQFQQQKQELLKQRDTLLTLLTSPPTSRDLNSLLDGYHHQYETLSPMLEEGAIRLFTDTIEAKKGVLNLLKDSYTQLLTDKTELQETVSQQLERLTELETYCSAGQQVLVTNKALIDAQAAELDQIKAAAAVQNSEAKAKIDDLTGTLENYRADNGALTASLDSIEVEKSEEYAKTLARTDKLKQNLQKLSAIQDQVDKISDEQIIKELKRLDPLNQADDETSGAIDGLVVSFGTLINQLNSKHSMELQTTHSSLGQELDRRLAEQLASFKEVEKRYLEEREQQIKEEKRRVEGDLTRLRSQYQDDLSEIEKKHNLEKVVLDARVSQASLAQITSRGLQEELDTTLSELEAVKKSLLEANHKASADLTALRKSLTQEISAAKKSEAERLQSKFSAELSEVKIQNEAALQQEQAKSKELELQVNAIRASLSSAEQEHKNQEEEAARQVEALKAEHTQKIKEATARGDAAAVNRLREQAAASEKTHRDEVARINREKESLKTALAANVAQLEAKVLLHAQTTEQLIANKSALSDAETRALTASQQVETLKVEHAKAIAEARKSGDDAAVTRLSESYQAQAADLERKKQTEIERIRMELTSEKTKLISDNSKALSDASEQHQKQLAELNAKHIQEIAAATEKGKDALSAQHQDEIRVLKQSHEEEQQRMREALTQKEGELRGRDELIESHAEKIREKISELERVQKTFSDYKISTQKISQGLVNELQTELEDLRKKRKAQITDATSVLNEQFQKEREETSRTALELQEQLQTATEELQAAVANAQEVSQVTKDFNAKLATKERELLQATAMANTIEAELAKQRTELERRVSEATNEATAFISTQINAADERVRLAQESLIDAESKATRIVDENLRNIDAAKTEASELVSKAQDNLRLAKEDAVAAKTQHEKDMRFQQEQLDAVRNELIDLTVQKDGEIDILNKSFRDAQVALKSSVLQTKDKDALLQSQRDRILELEANVIEISELKRQLSEKEASLAELIAKEKEATRSLQAQTAETIQALQTQLKQNEGELLEREERVTALSTELSGLKADNSSKLEILQSDYDALLADRNLLYSTNEKVIRTNESNLETLESLNSQLQEKQATIQQLNDTNAGIVAALNDVTTRNVSLIAQLDSEKLLNSEQIRQLEARLSAMDSTNKSIGELTEELASLQSTNQQKDEELEELKRQNSLLQEGKTAIETNLDEEKELSRAAVEKINDEKIAVESELSQVRQQLLSLVTEHNTSSSEITQLKKEQSRLKESLEQKTAELAQEKMSSLERIRKREDLEAKKTAATKLKEKALADEKEEYIRTIESLKQEKAAAESSLEDVNARLSAQQETNRSLAQEKETYSSTIEGLQQEKAAAESRLSQVNVQLIAQEETNTTLARRNLESIQMLDAEKKDLAAQLQATSADRNTIATDRDAIATDRDKIAADRDAKTGERDTIRVERDKIAARIRELEQENVDQLEKLREELRKSNASGAAAIKNSVEQKQQLQNQLRRIEELQRNIALQDQKRVETLVAHGDNLQSVRGELDMTRDLLRKANEKISGYDEEKEKLEERNKAEKQELVQRLRQIELTIASQTQQHKKDIEMQELVFNLKLTDNEAGFKAKLDETEKIVEQQRTIMESYTAELDATMLEIGTKSAESELEKMNLSKSLQKVTDTLETLQKEKLIGLIDKRFRNKKFDKKVTAQRKLISDLHKQFDAAQDELAFLRRGRQTYKKTVDQLVTEKIAAKKNASTAREELRLLTIETDKKVAAAQEIAAEVARKLAAAEQRLEAAETEMARAKQSAKAAADTSASTQRALQTATGRFQTKETQLNEEVKMLRQEVSDAQEEVKRLGKQSRDLEETRAALELSQEAKGEAEREIESLKEQLTIKGVSEETLTRQIKQAEENLKASERNEELLNTKIKTFKSLFIEVSTKAEKAADDAVQWKVDNIELSRKITQLESDLTSSRNALKQLNSAEKKQIRSLTATIAQKQEQLQNALRESKNLTEIHRRSRLELEESVRRAGIKQVRAEEQVTTLREAERIRTIDLELKQQEIDDTKSSYNMIEGQLIVNQEKLRSSEAKLKEIEKIKADSKDINEQFDINQKRLGRNKLELDKAVDDNERLKTIEKLLKGQLDELNLQYGKLVAEKEQLVAEKEQISKAAIRDIRVIKQKRLEDIYNLKLQQEIDNKETEFAERRHNEALTETAEIRHNEALDELRQQLLDKDAQHSQELALFSAAVDQAEAKNAEIELQLNSLNPLFIETKRTLNSVLDSGVSLLRSQVEQMSQTIETRGTEKIRESHAALKKKIDEYKDDEKDIHKLEELLKQKLQLFQELTGTLSAEIGKKEGENSRLSGELQTEKISVAGNLQKIEKQEQTIKQSQSELVAERQQIDKLKKENEAQMFILRFRKRRETQKDATIERQLRDLQEKEKVLDARETTIAQQLSQLEESKRNLELEKAKVQARERELSKEQSKVIEQAEKLKQQEWTLHNQAVHLKQKDIELDRRQHEINYKEKQLTDTKQALDQELLDLNSVLKDSQQAFKGSQVELGSKIKEVADGLEQLRLNQENLDDEKAKVAEQLEIINQQERDILKSQNDFQDELNDKDGEIERLQGELGNRDGTIGTLQEDIRKTKGALANRQSVLKIAEDELTAEQGKVSARDNTIGTLQGDIGTLQGDIGTLRGNIGIRDNTIGTLQATLATEQQKVLDREVTIGTEQQKVVARDVSISQLQDSGLRKDTDKRVLEQNITDLRLEINQKLGQLQVNKIGIERFQDQLDKAVADKTAVDAQLEKSKATISDLENNHLRTAKQEVVDMRSKLAELQSETKAYQNSCPAAFQVPLPNASKYQVTITVRNKPRRLEQQHSKTVKN